MTKSKPVLSVILPVYNSARHLGEAIESILKQTYSDFELIIINDGSTDKSSDVIEHYAKTDSRIRLISHAQNQGLVSTLNEGLSLANGTYIARMDADDIALPSRLEKQVKYLEKHSQVAVVATHITPFDDKTGKVLSIWPQEQQTKSYQDIKRLLPQMNCIAHPTIVGRLNVLRQYGYRESQRGIEDYDLWLRMVSDGQKISKVPEKLLRYRVSASSITGSDDGRKRLMLAKARFVLFRLYRFRFNKFDRSVLRALAKDLYLATRARAAKVKSVRMS